MGAQRWILNQKSKLLYRLNFSGRNIWVVSLASLNIAEDEAFWHIQLVFSTEVGIKGQTARGLQVVFKVVSQKRFLPHELIDDTLKRIKGILL